MSDQMVAIGVVLPLGNNYTKHHPPNSSTRCLQHEAGVGLALPNVCLGSQCGEAKARRREHDGCSCPQLREAIEFCNTISDSAREAPSLYGTSGTNASNKSLLMQPCQSVFEAASGYFESALSGDLI
jgi:hypothetical protein